MTAMTTRDNIVASAAQLFYRQGYENTSFADIAGAVQISRGNFYYHFKTKDEILSAVLAARMSDTKQMLDQWQAGSDNPEGRIRSFIHILIANRANIRRFGCPVGTLTTELAKLNHPSQAGATELFSLFRIWLRAQFSALGFAGEADALAMHLLARSQGVATLASAFDDETFIRSEVDQMCDWLASVIDRARPDKEENN